MSFASSPLFLIVIKDVINHAEAFEAAQRNHIHLQTQSDTVACLSEYK